MSTQFVLDIEWHTDRPLPRLVGPFSSEQEARDWARVNVPNGAWSVAPLAWPFARPTVEITADLPVPGAAGEEGRVLPSREPSRLLASRA